MNLELEIIEAVQLKILPDFLFSDNPISFYFKNGMQWLKISLIHKSGIRYAYHGLLSNDGQIQSRDCHSVRHSEISNRITEALNENEIGQKINAHF